MTEPDFLKMILGVTNEEKNILGTSLHPVIRFSEISKSSNTAKKLYVREKSRSGSLFLSFSCFLSIVLVFHILSVLMQ